MGGKPSILFWDLPNYRPEYVTLAVPTPSILLWDPPIPFARPIPAYEVFDLQFSFEILTSVHCRRYCSWLPSPSILFWDPQIAREYNDCWATLLFSLQFSFEILRLLWLVWVFKFYGLFWMMVVGTGFWGSLDESSVFRWCLWWDWIVVPIERKWRNWNNVPMVSSPM